MKGIETTKNNEIIKVNKPNLLRGWQTTAGFIGQCFKKLSLDNKN